MKLKDAVSQLANRINQPHVIEAYLRKAIDAGLKEKEQYANKEKIALLERLIEKWEKESEYEGSQLGDYRLSEAIDERTNKLKEELKTLKG